MEKVTAGDVYLGFWIDYPRRNLDKCQVLATEFWSQFMTGFVAVSLTLTTPYLFKIVKVFLVWLFSLIGRIVATWNSTNTTHSFSSSRSAGVRSPLLPQQSMDGREHSTENGSMDAVPVPPSEEASNSYDSHVDNDSISNGHQKPGRRSSITPLEILKDAEDSRDAVWKLVRYGVFRIKEQYESPAIIIVVITTILFGLFVAQTVAGIFSAKIASDRVGLASSRHCGIYQFDDDVDEETANLNDLIDYQKEARASQYARTCYESPNLSSPFSCQIFYNQSIAFETKTRQPCPFTSSELCFDGPLSAVTFDTGLVDASVIGINAPVTHKFRRTTSCSPLNGSEPYIRLSEGVNSSIFRYYYGTKDRKEYTFSTSGHPFEWLVPVYSVNTYFSSLYPDSDYWQPLPELKQPFGSTLAILFVSSLHIYYEEPTLDPIFYANEPRDFKGLRKSFYYNSDPRARVLACVDKSEVCSPDGKICWSMISPVPDKVPSPPSYWLMKWSLENSNTYDAIKWRLGTALLAQESVSQSVSLPLPHNQWQVEAAQLFATSLARIQYDALAIAMGEGHQRPGYIDVTPDEAKDRLCGLYKLKTSTYTNINLVAFVGLLMLAISIVILSLPVQTKPIGNDEQKPSSQPLMIEVILTFMYNLLVEIPSMIRNIFKFMYGVVSKKP